MRSVPDGWAAMVAAPHHLFVEADAWLGDVSLAEGVPIESGTVTIDGLALIQGRLDATIAGEAWIPTTYDAPLAPYGQELQVRAGIALTSGSASPSLLDLGRFLVETVDVDEGADGVTIRVTGGDRGARMTDAKFPDPWPVADGTNVVDAISAMAYDVMADLVIVAESTPFAVNAVTFPEGDDRWAAMHKLAASAGMWVRFDGTGQLVIATIPYVNDVSVADLVDGEGGTLVRVSRSLSRVNRPNGIVVVGEGSGLATPVRGVAYDLDPGSPTYWNGRYGKVLARYTSALAQSNAQATTEAQGRLATELGVTSQVRLAAVPNYALEPFDPCLIRREQLGVNELHALDRITLPLAPEPTMDVDTRVRQVVPAT